MTILSQTGPRIVRIDKIETESDFFRVDNNNSVFNMCENMNYNG